MVHLGTGLDYRGGAIPVRPLLRGDPLGHGLVGQAAVGAGDHHVPEVHMAGGGQHIHPVAPAPHVGPGADVVHEVVEDLLHEPVGVVVVVAVLGRLIPDQVQDAVVALEVVLQSLQQLLHGEILVVVDIVLHRRQAVGDGPGAHALDHAGVVAGTAGVVVLAPGDAVIGEDGQKRHGHVLGVQGLDDVGAPDLDVQEVVDLLRVGRPELVEGLKVLGLAGLQKAVKSHQRFNSPHLIVYDTHGSRIHLQGQILTSLYDLERHLIGGA